MQSSRNQKGRRSCPPTHIRDATRLFEKRVDIKVISELLGHSSTEITYKVYIHVIDAMKETAVEAIELD